MHTRRYKLIACNVFMRETCLVIAESANIIDPVFTDIGEHVHPDKLRAVIQKHIDAAADGGGERNYDAVLLAYGLCGNAAVGLTARSIPLVIPRAHDCCTILLGSRDSFQRHFGDNPSRPFSSAGYMDRGRDYLHRDENGVRSGAGDYASLVAKYGEENAAYIRDAMHPSALHDLEQQPVFIDIPEISALGHADTFAARAAADGKICIRLAGDLRLLRSLISGGWDKEEFLVVPPGHRTTGRYDSEIVIASEPANDG